MSVKFAAKKPRGHHIAETPLHPYEELRLKQCMRNSARLQQLGIPGLASMLANTNCTTTHKNKKRKSNEGSDTDYDPSPDDTDEGSFSDDDNAKHGSKNTNSSFTKSNKRPAGMPTTGVNTRSKRVFADQPSTRSTRSQESIALSNSNLTPTDQPTTRIVQSDGPDHLDEGTHLANGGHAPARSHGHNQMANQDDALVELDGSMPNGCEDITEHVGDIQIANEGGKERRERGPNMGHGLQRMNRARRGKLPVVIPNGKIRPVVPLVATKFATECNIVVRNHVPMLKHGKDYKKQPGLFKLFLGKLGAKFDINTSDVAVQKACSEMMKAAVRQQRYRLKKTYFDPFPLHLVTKTSPVKSMTNEQWAELVESWATPKKMETSQKNRDNRSLVKYHQTTGSRSYMVHVENLGEKYIDQEPNAFDLFKECHYSKKRKGYTSAVQLAITQMENKMSTSMENEEPYSATQVVADVLDANTKKSQFLQKVGIQNSHSKSSEHNIEAQLEVEKRVNVELSKQVELLSIQVQEAEQARMRDQEERTRDKEEMKNKQAEMEATIQLFLSRIQPS